MADSDVNLERFAHDVCVKVLEKFAVFKTPDDLRKENKYVCHDFLPRISRSVVSFALWIRRGLKNSLERNLKISTTSTDEEVMLCFHEYLLLFNKFFGDYWAENLCVSLSVCTEYIQFMSSKDIHVSLNKLVIKWKEFFDEHMKKTFEEKGGFSKLHDYLEKSQTDQLDKFHEVFISEYCRPYSTTESTLVHAKECVKKHSFNISLEDTIYGLRVMNYFNVKFIYEKMKRIVKSLDNESEEFFEEIVLSKPARYPAETHKETSDSEDYRSSSEERDDKKSQKMAEEDARSISEEGDDKTSQNMTSEASDSEMLNNLLGIAPHEETLREIDPFFVLNIPRPPKARTCSKSPERESEDSYAPRSSSSSPGVKSESSDPRPPLTDREDLKRKVEQILSNMGRDMATLKSLLLESGLFA